jgi:lantibiotic modifying enzyme
LIACAARIAGEIRETALTDCAGYRTWIVTEPVSRAGHQRLRATGYGLYDGVAGIALFLAAASRCTGAADAALLAADALAPLRARLRAAPSYADEHGLGGAGGAASAIYALTRAGVLLGDDSLLDDAMRAALQITPAVIARDTTFDVMYGSAGAILALLALFEARPRDWLVERAIDCGRRLLDSRRPLAAARDTTPRAWPSSRERRPVGLAHGASGIALALFRLHAATGVAEYASAAIDAVEADELLRNGSGTSWCRGSAGIGLVCLAPAAGSQALALRARARGCVSHVRMCSVLSGRGGDGLCCGTMGEVELLLTAGLRWGDATLLAAAHQRASHVIRRLRATRRDTSTGAERLHVADPALYRGTAGIGYSLLRLCHPEILPSLLSWE